MMVEVESGSSVDGDLGDIDDYEYATVVCRWPTVYKIAPTTIHLKTTFYDNGSTVLRITVFIDDVVTAVSGVYEGIVTREQAAVESRHSINKAVAVASSDIEESVCVWLQDARAALTDLTNGNYSNLTNSPTEYIHFLQRTDVETNGESLLFSWKMKLKPLGAVVLGTVRLSKVITPNVLVQQVTTRFVKPLVHNLLLERRRCKRIERSADRNEQELLKDNRQLLDKLQSIAESRQRDDQQLMTRFLKVLNAKKVRLAALKQELFELKQQQLNSSVVVADIEKEKSTMISGKKRDSRVGRGRPRKTKSNTVVNDIKLENSKIAMKKRRQLTAQYNSKWCSIFSEEEEEEVEDQRVDDININSNQQQEFRSMEIDNIGNTIITDNIVKDFKPETLPSTTVNVPFDDSVFDADTQIDNDSIGDNITDGSPIWFQNQSTITPYTTVDLSPPRVQNHSPTLCATTVGLSSQLETPSNKENNDKKLKNKSVLDDLWSGIL